MSLTKRLVFALVLAAAAVRPPAVAAAAGTETLAARQARVRTTDPRLRRLIDDGVRVSPTLRRLVDRLNASDVVVYLQCDGRSQRTRLDGRLTFLSAVGGFRYVLIRVQWLNPRERQLAILAHELQHAVEIASAPAIVDRVSLEREYHRIGYVNRWSSTPGIAFDTPAAVATASV